jgi:hypothetical protein
MYDAPPEYQTDFLLFYIYIYIHTYRKFTDPIIPHKGPFWAQLGPSLAHVTSFGLMNLEYNFHIVFQETHSWIWLVSVCGARFFNFGGVYVFPVFYVYTTPRGFPILGGVYVFPVFYVYTTPCWPCFGPIGGGVYEFLVFYVYTTPWSLICGGGVYGNP